MERLTFGFIVVLVIVVSGYEFIRWRNAQFRLGLTDAQRARRVIGALLSLAVSGMCFAGTYLPDPHFLLPRLVQAFEMVYWGVCLMLGFAIPVVGYIEAKETFQLLREEKRRISRELHSQESHDANGNG